MPFPISLQMYTVRHLAKADHYAAVRQVADAGYAAIEGGVPTGTTPAEYKKFLDDLGLRISSHWAWPTKENIGQLSEQANLFGYQHLINGFGPKELDTPENIQKSADKLKASAEIAAEHGLQFCMHNHAWEFDRVGGQLVFDTLMNAGGPKLASELDIYWASNFGTIDVPAVVRRYASRIPLLHVKDGPLERGKPNTAVGAGKLNIADCLRAADPAALKYLVVELDDYTDGHENMMAAVRDSIRWLVDQGLAEGR